MTSPLHPDEPIYTRLFDSYADLDLIRALLVEAFQPDRWDHNWEIRRWEGRLFHYDEATCRAEAMPYIRLWQTASGNVVAAAHPEGGVGIVYLDIHPDYRYLEEDIFDWAEDALAETLEDGQRRLRTVVVEYDTAREALITRRGYQKTPVYGVNRRRVLDGPIPVASVADGYTLRERTAGDPDECERWAEAIRAVFGHTFYTGEVERIFEVNAPSYRDDLSLVAETPDGAYAAFCGMTYMPELNLGIFEPIGTHPDHTRRGLQRALMGEGLRRLQALGATLAIVGTGDMIPANRLYEALGFTDVHRDWLWEKVW